MRNAKTSLCERALTDVSLTTSLLHMGCVMRCILVSSKTSSVLLSRNVLRLSVVQDATHDAFSVKQALIRTFVSTFVFDCV